MNVRQSFRRALLRKTHNTKVPQLEPGQACSYWRWRKRGLKKRGGWITARFLSWDPASPGKLAWVRSGTTTAMVAVEQLRSATGFEAWLPSEPDVAALKDASRRLTETMWADESGPPPPSQHLRDPDETVDLDFFQEADLDVTAALTSARSAAPPSRGRIQEPPQIPTAPPVTMDVDQTVNNLVYQPSVQNTIVQNIARLGEPNQGARRGGSVPRTPRGYPAPRTPRSRSPAPAAAPRAALHQQGQQELPPQLPQGLPEPPVPVPSQLRQQGPQELPQLPEGLPEPPVPPVPQTPLEPGWESAPFGLDSADYETDAEPDVPPPRDEDQQLPSGDAVPPQPIHVDPAETPVPPTAPGSQASDRPPTTPVSSSPTAPMEEAPNLLPAKRPLETLTTLFLDEGDLYHCQPGEEPSEGYGPRYNRCYRAYLSSSQRADDLRPQGKDPGESDSTDSDWNDEPQTKKDRGMTRAEAKALDREIPWRQILDMNPDEIQAYTQAVEKEARSWERVGLCQALKPQRCSEGTSRSHSVQTSASHPQLLSGQKAKDLGHCLRSAE